MKTIIVANHGFVADEVTKFKTYDAFKTEADTAGYFEHSAPEDRERLLKQVWEEANAKPAEPEKATEPAKTSKSEKDKDNQQK
jgi:hypothetical protein